MQQQQHQLSNIPVVLRVPLILERASIDGSSLFPFCVDRAHRNDLTIDVLERILRSKNRDPALVLAAAARGLQADNPLFSALFDRLYAELSGRADDEDDDDSIFTQAFFEHMGRHGCLDGMVRVREGRGLNMENATAFFRSAAKAGHLMSVLWIMDQMDEAHGGVGWVQVSRFSLSTPTYSAYFGGHIDVLDAILVRMRSSRPWTHGFDQILWAIIRDSCDVRNAAPPAASLRWLMLKHPEYVPDSFTKDVASAAIRVVPVPEVVAFIVMSVISRPERMLEEVAMYAFHHSLPDAAEELLRDHIVCPISLIRKACRALSEGKRERYRPTGSTADSTMLMVASAMRHVLLAPAAPPLLLTAVIDMMQCRGPYFEPLVLDALDRFPELESDVKVLAIALESTCTLVAERTLPLAVKTPGNRLVAIAAAEIAGVRSAYWPRLIPPGFFDDELGERLGIVSTLVATSRVAGFSLRESCRMFRVRMVNEGNIDLAEEIWPSSADLRANPDMEID